MAVPGGDKCVPLLAIAPERGGELAPLALWLPHLGGGGMAQARQGCTWLPGWDEFPQQRLIIVEGYVPGLFSAGQGHMVGVNYRGHVFCSRLGNPLQDRDLYAFTDVVLGRVGRCVAGLVRAVSWTACGRHAASGYWGSGVPLVALEGGGRSFVERYLYGDDGLAAASVPCPGIRGFCLSLGDPWLPVSLLPSIGRRRGWGPQQTFCWATIDFLQGNTRFFVHGTTNFLTVTDNIFC